MASKKIRPPKWPFPFFQHGAFAHRDEIRGAHWYLVFGADVPEADRAALVAGAPPPCAGPARWAGPLLLLESPPSRFFDAHVARAYGARAVSAEDHDDDDDDELAPTKADAEAFVAALDAWLEAVHARWPLALVIASHGNAKDPWSKWSVEQVPARVVPALGAALAGLRPPSAPETREGSSAERLAGWAAWRAIVSYFDRHDASSLDPAQRAAMRAVLDRARGYDGELDFKLDRLGRLLAPDDAPAS
jgi:hypothetical protein